MKLAIAIAISMALPIRALADDNRSAAREHVAAARALHAQQRYAEALGELEAAYALDPKPSLLFALGQIHVQLGRCERAIGFYKRFLATRPKPSDAAVAREAIEVCKASPPSTPDREPPTARDSSPATATVRTGVSSTPTTARDPSTATAVRTGSATPATARDSSTATTTVRTGVSLTPASGGSNSRVEVPERDSTTVESHRNARYAGIGLGAVGVGAAIGSLLLYRSANADRDRADAAVTYEEYEHLVERSRGRYTGALVTGVIGAAAITAGAIVFAIGRHDTVRVVPARGGGAVSWSTRF